jgi:CelD/BcsL family acetyltransferase involved in cellulose biosynthesis
MAPALALARTADEVRRLEARLAGFAWPRVDPDPDFFLTVLSVRPEVVRPHVVVLGDDSGAFVGRIEDVRFSRSIGYRPVFTPLLRVLTLVHGGVAGVGSEEGSEAIVDEVVRALEQGEADAAVLPGLKVGSVFHRAALGRASAVRRLRSERSVHRVLRLPAVVDDVLASLAPKTRNTFGRYARRLERAYGEALAFRTFCEPAELDELFETLEVVASKTYQRRLGVAISAEADEHRRLVRLGLERGWFRAYVLSIERAPVAFWTGFAYNGCFTIGTPGFDPAFAEYRVGTYAQLRMIESLCLDPAVSVLDYGFGDSEYKRRLSNESWEEETVTLFARRARPLAVSMGARSVDLVDSCLRRVLTRLGLVDRVKRLWRARLASSPRPRG